MKNYKLFIRKLDLFVDLDDLIFEKIMNLGERFSLEKDNYLCQENEDIDFLYVLLEGKLSVLIKNSEFKKDYEINFIFPGEAIGEISLLLPEISKRSASIKTIEDSLLFCISIKKLNELFIYPLSQEGVNYRNFLHKLQNNLVGRLIKMNHEKVVLIENETSSFKQKYNLSLFIIYVVSILCVFTFFIQWLSYLIKSTSNTTFISLPVTIILALLIIRLATKFNLSLNTLGIHKKNLTKSILEGTLFTLPILILMTASKYLIVSKIPQYSHLPTFDLFETNTIVYGSRIKSIIYTVALSTMYLTIIVPLQELICRSILQLSLERFLIHKHRYSMSIIISNLIYASLNMFLSLNISIITFIVGVYFGFLFYRTKNLISPLIAHGLIGFWGLFMLNLGTLF